MQLHPSDQPAELAHRVADGRCAEMAKEKLELDSDNPARGDEELDRIVLETSSTLARQRPHHNHHHQSRTGASSNHSSQAAATEGEPTSAAGGAELNRLLQPKRPMNAFMVWGQSIRRELHNRYTNVQNAMLSKALGRVWRQLTLEDKRLYIERASAIKANHKRAYPNYRYQPRRIQEKHFRQQQEASRNNRNNNSSSTSNVQALELATCSSSESSIGFQQITSSSDISVGDLESCLPYANQAPCVNLERHYAGQAGANNCAPSSQHAGPANYDTHPNGAIIYYGHQTGGQQHNAPSTDGHARVFVDQHQQPAQYQAYGQQAAVAAGGISYSISGQPDGYACNMDGHMDQNVRMIETIDQQPPPPHHQQQEQHFFDYHQRTRAEELSGWDRNHVVQSDDMCPVHLM